MDGNFQKFIISGGIQRRSKMLRLRLSVGKSAIMFKDGKEIAVITNDGHGQIAIDSDRDYVVFRKDLLAKKDGGRKVEPNNVRPNTKGNN